MRRTALVALAATLLASCGSQSDKSAWMETPGDVAAKVSASNCGTASITFLERPGLPLSPELKPDRRAYGRLKTAIDTAWASACDKGVIPAGGLKENGKPLSPFKVFNNPNANTTGIYADDGYAILESPMHGLGEGELNIPEKGEIEEALYCFVNGPPEGDNPEGRCLVD